MTPLLFISVVSLAVCVYVYVPELTLATNLLSAKSLVSLLASLESGDLKRTSAIEVRSSLAK
jgi:hypothetical protein